MTTEDESVQREATKLQCNVYLPKDQISTSGPYGSLEITSGDIQYGVPTNDFLLGSSCDTCAQKPKSDSFT